jgi:hypothetical protein
MKNTNRVLIGVIVVLILVLVALVGWREWSGESSFTAMYLRSGDLYFGHLTRFPHYGLKQVYLLQVNSQNTENPLSVQRFANVFWGPEDFLNINRDEVVWTTTLSDASELQKLLRENPMLTSQQNTQPQAATNPAPTPAPTTGAQENQ